MRIALGADHAAAAFKQELLTYVRSLGHTAVDYGVPLGATASDYPVSAEITARAVASGDCDLGLVCCGTGQGVMLAANKVRGIRCAVCTDCYSAAMARQHNDANMLALGARVLGIELAKLLVSTFLSTPFEGGRHAVRVGMITDIERRESAGEVTGA
ncbi:MAG: ribose 5-phosphate isomerase B [Oscillospiraceae bacterium]|jgi:ribose 5-phosphate isomerase B|nr:ribose 5-phosphate isomerase B [Oscillospiraceae bacterium]